MGFFFLPIESISMKFLDLFERHHHQPGTMWEMHSSPLFIRSREKVASLVLDSSGRINRQRNPERIFLTPSYTSFNSSSLERKAKRLIRKIPREKCIYRDDRYDFWAASTEHYKKGNKLDRIYIDDRIQNIRDGWNNNFFRCKQIVTTFDNSFKRWCNRSACIIMIDEQKAGAVWIDDGCNYALAIANLYGISIFQVRFCP